MSKFPWGKIIEKFDLDFNGDVLVIVKYHPWVNTGERNRSDDSVVLFHCDEIHESRDNIYALVIAWMARKQLGLNQQSLVDGICRALMLDEIKQ